MKITKDLRITIEAVKNHCSPECKYLTKLYCYLFHKLLRKDFIKTKNDYKVVTKRCKKCLEIFGAANENPLN